MAETKNTWGLRSCVLDIRCDSASVSCVPVLLCFYEAPQISVANKEKKFYFEALKTSLILTSQNTLNSQEEFQLALFKNKDKRNLFADRIFDVFDVKRNGVIEFGEFVRSLGVFHPNAPVEDKTACKNITLFPYVSNCNLKEMVLALLHESELVLSDDVIEVIVDKVQLDPYPCSVKLNVLKFFVFSPQTYSEADKKGDGRIDQEEWREFVLKHPSLIKNMTLPYLKDITLAFPSFVMSSEVEDSEI
ncbi:hypothetical protein GBA52_005958 [Prunus armeniaca]|nr:hypothetical protein GBA52_005958 [Prunus armeniaca]